MALLTHAWLEGSRQRCGEDFKSFRQGGSTWLIDATCFLKKPVFCFLDWGDKSEGERPEVSQDSHLHAERAAWLRELQLALRARPQAVRAVQGFYLPLSYEAQP